MKVFTEDNLLPFEYYFFVYCGIVYYGYCCEDDIGLKCFEFTGVDCLQHKIYAFDATLIYTLEENNELD